MKLLTHLLALVLIVAPAWAQSTDSASKKAEALKRLGRFLFESTHLSGNGRVSCATCHDSELSFIDGRRESLGILEVGVGRNAPSLFALEHVEHFPGPRLTDEDPLARRAALTLAERCLAPIENPLEMCSSLEDVVDRLRSIKVVEGMFRDAYGPSANPVRAARIGDALAAHIRSFDVPETGFGRHLAGEERALDPIERHGFEIFNQQGKCSACHTGGALSDGLVHVAFLPGSERDRAQQRRTSQIGDEVAEQMEWMQFELPQTGIARRVFSSILLAGRSPRASRMCGDQGVQISQGYDGFPQVQVNQTHTLPLWDVARTGPYFRDGSVKKLDEAIAIHVAELRGVWKDRVRIKKLMKRSSRARLPRKLQPSWAKKTRFNPPRPAELDRGEIFALTKFLTSLSPDS